MMLSGRPWRVRLAAWLVRGLGYYVVPKQVGEAAYRMLQAEEIGLLLAEQARIRIEPSGAIVQRPEIRQ